MLRISRAQQKAFALATLLCASATAFSATPPNTAISNTATASYSIGATPLTSTGTVSVSTAACVAVGVNIELLQYIPPARAALAPIATNVPVPPAAYSPSG
ncbi:MAG: hypothetical protein OEV26_04475, partial [Gallionella sp.]|nr:hypothetical protein [Gallionella sp.]